MAKKGEPTKWVRGLFYQLQNGRFFLKIGKDIGKAWR